MIMSAQERYLAAVHAMQSGVEYWRQIDPSETSPKHLRVGVNSALESNGALLQLLIDKGIITKDEYTQYLIEAVEADRDDYARKLQEHYGPNGPKITLR